MAEQTAAVRGWHEVTSGSNGDRWPAVCSVLLRRKVWVATVTQGEFDPHLGAGACTFRNTFITVGFSRPELPAFVC